MQAARQFPHGLNVGPAAGGRWERAMNDRTEDSEIWNELGGPSDGAATGRDAVASLSPYDHETADGAPSWRRLPGLVFATVLSLLAVSLALCLIYRFVGPVETWNMLGRRLGGKPVYHRTVPLSAISPNLVKAVIAAEDSRFCQHNGFDFQEIRQAMDEKQRRGYLRGASTLSQQTAKNVYLWNGGGWVRKGAETWFTVLDEAIWGKRRTMEHYLNVAEWGDGLYGAEAAALGRFGVSAKDLSPRQAALLAAVLPSPNKWRVDPPGPYVGKRAGQIQARMQLVARDGLADCVLKN